jgi:hypothetical protein
MNKRTMMAHVATLTAALAYVVTLDENGNKITPELLSSLSSLVQDTKNVFEFDGEEANFPTYEENETALFEMWADEGVDDLTGQYF